jgi:hypothetical protein
VIEERRKVVDMRTHPPPSAAAFIRGFFAELDLQGIATAVLHGWQGAFEDTPGDVDFAVESAAFRGLVPLVHQWCVSQGWRLCQVLRHETTAAYCVCASVADPGVIVALDACSDYRRNETVLLTAEELLARREPMPWGGMRLAEAMELRYRVVKAAVKKKDPAKCAAEFAHYSAAAHADATEWLKAKWGIILKAWDVEAVSEALRELRGKTRNRPPLFALGSLWRIGGRILYPSGLMIIADREPEWVEELERRCGSYFRRTRTATFWQAGMLRDLVQSTAIFLPRRSGLASRLIPAYCVLVLNPSWDLATCIDAIATALAVRCAKRNGLRVGQSYEPVEDPDAL